MTVRNIRAHQSRGLLPPPEVRGRTGYYGAEHVARLELIREMQAEGFNLEAIRKLLAQAGTGSSPEILRLTRTVREPFVPETSEILDAEEIVDRFKPTDARTLPRAVALGVMAPVGDGKYEIVSSRLANAAEELVALGIPIERALDLYEIVHRRSEQTAEAFVRLFLDEIWAPFDAAGRPEDRWGAMQDALERLRPLAVDAVLAGFNVAMSEAIERAMEETIGAMLDEEPRRSGSSRRDGPRRRSPARSRR